MGKLQVFAEINGYWELDELPNFPHRIGEPLELEGCNLGDGFEEEPFAGVGAYFAVLTEIFIMALEFVDCKEAGDALCESI